MQVLGPKRAITTTGGLILGAVLVLSACHTPAPPADVVASGGGFDGDYFAQSVEWAECDDELLYESPSSWLSSPDHELLCGEVIVPAHYDDLTLGADFRIQLAKLTPAPEDQDRDVIFINPGGPGGSGVDQVQYSEFPKELLDAFDIVGFDPRGVGTSVFTTGEAIRCSDELDYLSYFHPSAPQSLAEYTELVALGDEYFLDCVERNPLWWTLSTAAVVKDLDVVRQAVTRDKPLNFIGSSYGTTIAGRYVTEFPDRVGKIVFDSPTTVDEDRIASRLESIAADEEKLRGFLTGYATTTGITFDAAVDRLVAIRDGARNGTMFGFAGPTPSPLGQGQVTSEALFHRGLLTMNYLPESMAQTEFNEAVDLAFGLGDLSIFEWWGFVLDGYNPSSLFGSTLADKELERSTEFDVRFIVNSMDFSLPELTEDEQRDFNARVKEVAPVLSTLWAADNGWEYVGPRLGTSFSDIATNDPAIPSPPNTPFIPRNTSGVPFLIVGSTKESVTPFSFARDTANLLDSILITVESSEHGPAAGYSIPCLNDVLIRFFTTDTPPSPVTCPG
jgi:pimeloyl-ACP methyl ester carboxylesterase